MTTVRDIEQYLYAWAPRELAESWDNVGLLVGDPEVEVHRVLVALDVTPQVVDEAIEKDCQLIAAHHPVMNCAWNQVQTVRTDDRQGRVLTELIRHGIAAICMHTNLDAAAGGVNEVLVAVGGGACGCYIPQAIAAGCDTFVTSDLKYNDFLDTEGLNLIDAGHFPTENVVCPALRDRLAEAFPAVDVLCSTSHSREIIQYCIKEK